MTQTAHHHEEQRAELPEGIVLPYVDAGPRDAPPVVLLHGFLDSWRSFLPVLPHLAGRVRAVSVTQRGHGDASKPSGPYDPRAMADDVIGLLDALGIERATLAGHSMGSAVALQAAVAAPERVAGLVLGAAHSAHAHATPALGAFAAAIEDLSDPVPRALVEEIQAQARDEGLPAGLFDAMVQGSLRMPARVWKAVLAGLETFDVDADLPRVEVPVVLAWGEADPFFDRATQRVLLDRLPEAELHVYPGAGHTVHWDHPAAFAEDVLAVARR
jgi:pimeloyl-ACP methyl ester carboxylesterase